MATFKSVAKLVLFISLVLAVGQVPVGKATLGGLFLTSVTHSAQWTGKKMFELKWFSGLELPAFLKDAIEGAKDMTKSGKSSQLKALPEQEVSSLDKKKMLDVLEGKNDSFD